MSEQNEMSLEMRVAALEDKLAQTSVTAEEMRAFQKVSALAGADAPTTSFFCSQCFNCVVVRSVSVPVGGTCARFTQQTETRGGGSGFGGLGH
jgi:hypothetical protein